MNSKIIYSSFPGTVLSVMFRPARPARPADSAEYLDAKTHCKIVTRVFGGLGNQLFIYAAARRLALTNCAELVLDHVSGFTRDYDYRRHYQLDCFHIPCRKATAAERLEPFSRVRRFFGQRMDRQVAFGKRRYIQQEGIDFDPRLLLIEPLGTVYLEGYWQSEGYFKDIETTLCKELQIKPPTDIVNQAMAEIIRSRTAVAVHVRFFDEPNVTATNNAPADYYVRAIAEMERRVTNAHYYVFSDSPEAARARIPLPEERITKVTQNQGDMQAYADLWLMAHCRHFIIANSTFSWWGAWLGTYPGKQVIAPGFVMRHGKAWWGFEGLLPEKWVKI